MTRAEIAQVLATNISARRRKLKLTRLDVAARMSAPVSHVHRLEAGTRLSALDTVAKVARALDVPLVKLLKGIA